MIINAGVFATHQFGPYQPWDFTCLEISFSISPLIHQKFFLTLSLCDPPKGLLLISALLFWDTHSPTTILCTRTSDQSVSGDLTEDIKNGACTANVLTETRAQDSAPLALTSV